MRISTLSKAAAIALVVGFALSIGSGLYALRELKVNGPLYERIALGKDLVADILPPPAYILEAYLEASLLRHSSGDRQVRLDRLKELKKEYFDRHEFWKQQTLNDALRQAFLERAHQPAVAFWQLVGGQYARAIVSNDAGLIEKLWTDLTTHYALHREGIDAVVKLANAFNQDLEKEAARLDHRLTAVLIVSAMCCLVVIGICLAGLRQRLVNPLLHMRSVMARLSEGDLQVNCDHSGRKDEIGEMRAAVKIFHAAALERQRMEREAEQRHAEIENERRLREEERVAADQRQVEALKFMADQVEQAARKSVAVVVEQMDMMTDLMTSLSGSTISLRDDSDVVASAAEETLATMKQTARSTVVLNATVKAVVGQVDVAADVNRGAVNAASLATSRIRSLADTIARIEGFTQTINDIARNTNLLALNASVEAARSGEHGRGFSVIAQEVKLLSEQTSRATSEINTLIGSIIEAKDGALSAVRDIDIATEKARETANDIGTALKAQVVTIDEIAQGITETERAASDVAQKIQRVAGETQAAGQRSEDANAICALVSDRILDLQSELIHSLRTSSEYVNRRREPRLTVHRKVRVLAGGKECEVELINISSRGALLAGCLGHAGNEVEITISGHQESYLAAVIRSNSSTTSIKFDAPIAVKSLGQWREVA